MANRYKNTKLTKDPTGTRVYKPTVYPKIPIKNSDLIITPKEGERKGTMKLTPGERIRIPRDIQSINKDLKAEEYV
jgi:hypothetical protein